METKGTNALVKLSVSIVNVFFVLLLSAPLYYLWGFTFRYKLALVIVFFVYNLFFLVTTKNRCLGMIILNIYWKEDYPKLNQYIYIVLYTLSFSTAVVWLLFPFDVLLVNLMLVQLPFVLKTGTTAHGYLSGKMSGFRKA